MDVVLFSKLDLLVGPFENESKIKAFLTLLHILADKFGVEIDGNVAIGVATPKSEANDLSPEEFAEKLAENTKDKVDELNKDELSTIIFDQINKAIDELDKTKTDDIDISLKSN